MGDKFNPFDIDFVLAQEQIAKPRSSYLLATVRVMVILGLLSGIAIAIYGFIWLKEIDVFSINASDINKIASARPSDNSKVLDRNGKLIGEFFNTYHIYVPFNKIPPTIVNAITSIEDQRFWVHKGFDPKAILRAAFYRIKSNSSQGASTITQQLVRHFLLNKEKTLKRKTKEIALAIQLEKSISKQKIFELYANTLFLGNGAYGVGAAAKRYFGKKVDSIQTHEAAVIAGLFQSPSRYNPVRYPERAKKRQRLVLKAMYKAGKITKEELRVLLKRKIEYKSYKPVNSQFAPYFVDYIRERSNALLGGNPLDNQGLRIHTTLDMNLQRQAEQSMAESEPLLVETSKDVEVIKNDKNGVKQATLEAALLSMDPKTGEILALVGGRDYNKSQFNRPIQALRSPGSAFKPIVFSVAIDKGWKWSDVIFVSPVTVNRTYRPHTPTNDYLTETTLLRAFYRSMNTPTIELGTKIGLGPVLRRARSLGIRTKLKTEFGTMLGSSDATMLDMARVYSSFANFGNLVEPIAITKIVNQQGKVLYTAPEASSRSERVLKPQTAYLLTEGMRQVMVHGTGYKSSHLAARAVGKTGTSNKSTDNWFCGYTPNLVTITWVGTDEHKAIWGNKTGGKLALPIWDRFMTKAIPYRPKEYWQVPPGVYSERVHSKFGTKSPKGITMWFLRGQGPNEGTSALETLQTKRTGYRDIFTH